jgi:hypothetical protein
MTRLTPVSREELIGRLRGLAWTSWRASFVKPA